MRIKKTGETGRVNAADGGVVYVTMEHTNEAKIFSASGDEDAYIELCPSEANVQHSGVEQKPVLEQGAANKFA